MFLGPVAGEAVGMNREKFMLMYSCRQERQLSLRWWSVRVMGSGGREAGEQCRQSGKWTSLSILDVMDPNGSVCFSSSRFLLN
jgi:hypothetical protein